MDTTLFTLSLIILGLPFFMFLILGLLGKYMKNSLAGILGTCNLAVLTGIAYTIAIVYFFGIGKTEGTYLPLDMLFYNWMNFTPTLALQLGIYLDPISVMMLVVITTVSLMVHIYSLGYMHGEKGYQRYYAFLSLFSFSMLGLVLATNIFQMYVFWELVGVSSFLLISFYFIKPSAVAAAKKAFIVTRFADFFFLVGILLISLYADSFDFSVLNNINADPNSSYIGSMEAISFMGMSAITWAALLMFIGGAGKSAMMPFHIWLPDAMEGPTPASALIHAATMVVAGVYLVARLFPVYYFGAHIILDMIAWIGAATAIYAAIVACTQTDIKRVLAFSTISQIAFMITALGCSNFDGHGGLGYMGAMFHLFTHAFFKALLFLGAGSVIHAVHSNEMKDMGGLAGYMPITRWTFLIACLAIAGIFPFSGFWSKDEILVAAFEHNHGIYAILAITSMLTAFYMFRLYYRIFFHNKFEMGHGHHSHLPHESPISMTFPMIFLAVYAALGGLPFSVFGMPEMYFSQLVTPDRVGFDMHIDYIIAITSTVGALIGIGVATMFYYRKTEAPDKIAKFFGVFYKWAEHKFYFDELWLFVTRKIIFKNMSRPIAWFDKNVVDGFMNMLAGVTQSLAFHIRSLQSGRIQQYTLIYILGSILLIISFCGWLLRFILKENF